MTNPKGSEPMRPVLRTIIFAAALFFGAMLGSARPWARALASYNQTASVLSVTQAHGESCTVNSFSDQITLNVGTTSTNLATALPANSYVFGVATRVTSSIGAGGTYSIKDSSNNVYINAASPVTAGSTAAGWMGGAGTFFTPFYTASNTFKIITSNVASSGVVRVTVFYVTLGTPTS
jgi:hypothetical protein